MKGKKRAVILLLMGLSGLYGCGSPSADPGLRSGERGGMGSDSAAVSDMRAGAEAESVPICEHSMELQYAENFTVDYYEGGYTLLTTTMDDARFLIVPEDTRRISSGDLKRNRIREKRSRMIQIKMQSLCCNVR